MSRVSYSPAVTPCEREVCEPILQSRSGCSIACSKAAQCCNAVWITLVAVYAEAPALTRTDALVSCHAPPRAATRPQVAPMAVTRICERRAEKLHTPAAGRPPAACLRAPRAHAALPIATRTTLPPRRPPHRPHPGALRPHLLSVRRRHPAAARKTSVRARVPSCAQCDAAAPHGRTARVLRCQTHGKARRQAGPTCGKPYYGRALFGKP